MEGPDQLAGAHVPGALVARRALDRRFLHARARDDQVAIDDRRAAHPERHGAAVHDLRRLHVDDAVDPEVGGRLAGGRIERGQFASARAENDARANAPAARPVATPRVDA